MLQVFTYEFRENISNEMIMYCSDDNKDVQLEV